MSPINNFFYSRRMLPTLFLIPSVLQTCLKTSEYMVDLRLFADNSLNNIKQPSKLVEAQQFKACVKTFSKQAGHKRVDTMDRAWKDRCARYQTHQPSVIV